MSWIGWTLLGAALVALIAWCFERSRRRTHPVPPGLQPAVTLPHTQEFELYHNALSLCSMKTRLCLAELEIPYRSHAIDLIETGRYENIRPAFLAVNPAGTVPVLVHDGHPIYESHEQIRYAAQHAPPGAPRLIPADAALRDEMERWIDRSSLTDDPLEHGDRSAGNAVPGLTVPLFTAMIDRIEFWKIFEGLCFHSDKRRPLIFLLLKLVGLGSLAKIPPVVRIVARSHRQLAAHLDALEAQLARTGGPWILGATFSLADVSWCVIFERLAQVDALEVHLGPDGRDRERVQDASLRSPASRPLLAAYWERLKARDSHRIAIREFAHATIVHGTEGLRTAKAADPVLRAALEGRSERTRARRRE